MSTSIPTYGIVITGDAYFDLTKDSAGAIPLGEGFYYGAINATIPLPYSFYIYNKGQRMVASYTLSGPTWTSTIDPFKSILFTTDLDPYEVIGNNIGKLVNTSILQTTDFPTSTIPGTMTYSFVITVHGDQIPEGGIFKMYPGDNGTTDIQPGVYAYPEGTTVNFTAIPNSGYKFVRWYLNGSPASTINPGYVIATTSVDKSVYPKFELIT